METRGGRGWLEGSGGFGHPSSRRATLQVVVDQPHGLHERIDNRGPHEGPAPLLEVLRKGQSLRARGQARKKGLRDPMRPLVRLRPPAPEVTGKRPKLAPKLQGAPCVLNRRLDLGPISHDARVPQERFGVTRRERSDRPDVEVMEGGSKGLPLAEDGDPGEPRLKPLEAELLEESGVGGHGEAPLAVVVAPVEVVVARPPAPDDAIFTADEASRQPGHGVKNSGKSWGGEFGPQSAPAGQRTVQCSPCFPRVST